MAVCHEICDLVERSAWSGDRVGVVAWQLNGSPGEFREQGSATNVGGVAFVVGNLCIFWFRGNK